MWETGSLGLSTGVSTAYTIRAAVCPSWETGARTKISEAATEPCP